MADDDWKALGTVWQESDDIDTTRLRSNIKRKVWLIRLWVLTETLICMVGAVFVSFNLLGADNSRVDMFLGLLLLGFCLVGVYLAWWVHAGAWKPQSYSALDELKFLRARANAKVRYAIANLWMAPFVALILGFTDWAIWSGLTGQGYEIRILATRVAYSIAVAGYVAWALWYKQRKKRDVAALDQVISEMED